ncbi:MAG: hypothetical protein IJ364_02565 [Oscillospiraceae bacterium]|nr:hypothetical protein [Oscillospiraceae bacterium]
MAEKTGNMAVVYGIIALLSVLLLAAYLFAEKRKEQKFIALFSCVATVNCGYFFQAVSGTLSCAMLANRISYLGAAYSVLVMLLIIMDACRMERKKCVTAVLFAVSTAAFLLAASGGWQGLYYETVDIETVNGMTRLVKEYGPLHILYPVYLLLYFSLMIAVIFRSYKKGRLSSLKYATFLVAVALTNLIVWAVEQCIHVDFEFLSVSYIATEIMLLAIFSMLRDYGIIQSCGVMLGAKGLPELKLENAVAEIPPGMGELFDAFAGKISSLSSAERRILDLYIQGHEIAEIPELAFITINTVKKHNRSIYQKLDVASRDELMLYIELFRRCGRLNELVGKPLDDD